MHKYFIGMVWLSIKISGLLLFFILWGLEMSCDVELKNIIFNYASPNSPSFISSSAQGCWWWKFLKSRSKKYTIKQFKSIRLMHPWKIPIFIITEISYLERHLSYLKIRITRETDVLDLLYIGIQIKYFFKRKHPYFCFIRSMQKLIIMMFMPN